MPPGGDNLGLPYIVSLLWFEVARLYMIHLCR